MVSGAADGSSPRKTGVVRSTQNGTTSGQDGGAIERGLYNMCLYTSARAYTHTQVYSADFLVDGWLHTKKTPKIRGVRA
jgi:hypothetical protein